MTSTWHADTASLARYADGGLDPAGSASIEAHLLRCDACRATLAATADDEELEAMWRGVADRVDVPRRRLVERGLCAAGIRETTARLVAATPALRASWLAAVAIALGFAVFAAYQQHGDPIAFLWLAPLVPLAGVATAYGPDVDPTFEVGVATPTHGQRLLMLRTTAVGTTAVVLLVPASLALPGFGLLDVAWLVPAIGVALATLALATFIGPTNAGIVVGAGWIALVPASVWVTSPHGSRVASHLALFGARGQLAAAAVAVAAVIVLVVRRDRFDVATSL